VHSGFGYSRCVAKERGAAVRGLGEWLEDATVDLMAKKGWDFDKALDMAAFLVVLEYGKMLGRKEANHENDKG
jgi:hypothetical protein